MSSLNQTLKKKMYKSQILHLLHSSGNLSQITISQILSLPKTTVSSIINDAIKSSLIMKIGQESGQRKVPGIRPVLLGLDNAKSFVLGLSVRDGFLYSGLVNFYGNISNAKTCKLDNSRKEHLPRLITEAIDDVLKSGKFILGAGLAIGGYFKGINKSLEPENNFNLSTKIPLIVDDYPNAAAKAELLFGQAKGREIFVFLQLKDNDCRVSCYNNGDIVRGAHGLAGEVSAINYSQRDTYVSPFHLYQHLKIKNFEDSSPSEIKEHSFHLANIILQILIFFDPHQIIISGVPEKIWGKVSGIIDGAIKSWLDFDLYNLKYEILQATQWENKEIKYGASLVFEDILMHPRVGFKEPLINL